MLNNTTSSIPIPTTKQLAKQILAVLIWLPNALRYGLPNALIEIKDANNLLPLNLTCAQRSTAFGSGS